MFSLKVEAKFSAPFSTPAPSTKFTRSLRRCSAEVAQPLARLAEAASSESLKPLESTTCKFSALAPTYMFLVGSLVAELMRIQPARVAFRDSHEFRYGIASYVFSLIGSWSIFAERMKSFSESPPIACVHSSIQTLR